MRLHCALLTLTAISITISDVVSSAGLHSAQFKSIQSSYGECNQYLPSDSLRQECGTRCVALVNRIWNETAGRLSEATGRFYTQDPQDPCSHNRTEQCLSDMNSTIPQRDSCKRANASVDCYLNNYGQLNVTGLRYVPFTDIQQVRILSECAAMLGVSNKMDQVVRSGIQSIPEGACLLRCLLIRQGLYSDETGPDLDRISVQCNGYGDNEGEWRANVTQCVAAVQAEGSCGRCTLAERIAIECLQMHLELYAVKNAEIRELIPFTIEFYTEAGAAAGADAVATAKSVVTVTVYVPWWWYYYY